MKPRCKNKQYRLTNIIRLQSARLICYTIKYKQINQLWETVMIQLQKYDQNKISTFIIFNFDYYKLKILKLLTITHFCKEWINLMVKQ